MSEHPFLRRNWKLIVNVGTLVALGILVYVIRDDLVKTFENLGRVNAWFLALMLPLQMANYHAQTKLYQGLFGIVGNRLKYKDLFKVALELNFVNHVFPSGGVSGVSYFGIRMRREGVAGSRATVAQLMKLLLLFLSFEVLLVLGLLTLAAGGQASDFIILLAGSLTTLLVVGTFGFVVVIRSRHRIQVTFTFLARVLNRLIRFVRPNNPETISIIKTKHAFETLHDNYMAFESRWRGLKWPLVWAFLANLTEILTIYVVYLAFGSEVNIGAIMLAYGVANFAGFISILPGGVGIYEALMTGVLVAAGVPASLSISATVMYRVINTIIQVVPGYFLYRQAIHNAAG